MTPVAVTPSTGDVRVSATPASALAASPASTAEQLDENFKAAVEEIVRLKPSSSKGRYIQKGAVSTTFGPGIPLDVNTLV